MTKKYISLTEALKLSEAVYNDLRQRKREARQAEVDYHRAFLKDDAALEGLYGSWSDIPDAEIDAWMEGLRDRKGERLREIYGDDEDGGE